MKLYMEERLKNELPTSYASDMFKNANIESITWTDFPAVIPQPMPDPSSPINGDNLDYDYHFTVVVNENGNSVSIPIIVRIEFE